MQPFECNVQTVDKKILVMFATNNETDQHAHLKSSFSALFFHGLIVCQLIEKKLASNRQEDQSANLLSVLFKCKLHFLLFD